jgi:Family of unknown function (DUF5678)
VSHGNTRTDHRGSPRALACGKGQIATALDSELEQPAPQSRAEETAWIDRHRDEYLGQWVAIEGDTLIAHGANPREVYLAAREAGVNSPFIERVEKRQDALMGGWQ